MQRRTFLHTASGAIVAGTGTSFTMFAADAVPARHLPATVVSAPPLATPAGKQVPFGWQEATVAGADNAPVILAWPDLPPAVTPTHFRIAIGLDERDAKMIEAFLPKSGRVIGTFDMRFVSQFQVYELAIAPADVAAIRSEGIGLRLTSGSDLEIFTGGANAPAALRPHLLMPGTLSPAEEFLARMNSIASIQEFGWMEGCILDGLLDLGELPHYAYMKDMARKHLELFCPNGKLVYQSPSSAPIEGKVYGIEGSLPFGAMARLDPKNPLLDIAIAFWQDKKNKRKDNSIQDGTSVSSEGAYTVGYAMAEVARARKSEELMQLAIHQVRDRQTRLFDGKTFWRTRTDADKRGNRNWCRGIAWQILGLTRTLMVAKDRADITDLVTALQQFATWAVTMQREDGLWSVFADDQSLTPDTAGSAGIGAALAIGARHGFLDAAATAVARKTLTGLHGHLTPDGFLGGVSQSNKGGEGLQRSTYRSIFQMGMGLQAQLSAALA